MELITVLVVDDHRLIRDSWCLLLKSNERFKVVAEASDTAEAARVTREKKPSVVLMDVNMDIHEGVDAVALIHTASPTSRVVTVTMHAMPVYAKKMFRAGAAGYVTKNSSSEELIKAVLAVHDGERYICDEVKNIILSNSLEKDLGINGINGLTQREIEIAQLLKEGLSSREMGTKLDISSKTVEVHRASLLKKLNQKNTAALVNYIYLHDL